MDAYKLGEYDKVYVVYSQFRNAAVQDPKAAQFLPVPKMEGTKEPGETDHKADYLFEPSQQNYWSNSYRVSYRHLSTVMC